MGGQCGDATSSEELLVRRSFGHSRHARSSPSEWRCVGILMPLTADDPMNKLGGRIHAGTGGGLDRASDMRWGGEVDRIRRSAMELVALTPDVISSIGTNATVALQQASRTVPVCQRTSGFSAPDVNGFRHRPGSNKVLACHSQKNPKRCARSVFLIAKNWSLCLPAYRC